MHCCCYLLATYLDSVAVFRSKVSLNSTETQVKSCFHVALAARIIRKNKVNRTLNRFDGLPAQKHLRSLAHDIWHYSLTIVRPSYNFGGKTT